MADIVLAHLLGIQEILGVEIRQHLGFDIPELAAQHALLQIHPVSAEGILVLKVGIDALLLDAFLPVQFVHRGVDDVLGVGVHVGREVGAAELAGCNIGRLHAGHLSEYVGPLLGVGDGALDQGVTGACHIAELAERSGIGALDLLRQGLALLLGWCGCAH